MAEQHDSPRQPTAVGKGDTDERGEAMASLVHDLNQPLTAIGNYAQAGKHLIESGYPDIARLKELFEKIAAQSNRGFEISQELRHTARQRRE